MVVPQSVIKRWQNLSYCCDGDKNGNACVNANSISPSCKTYQSCNCLELQPTLFEGSCSRYSSNEKKHDTINIGELRQIIVLYN